ncbi:MULTISPECIES: oligosaccharide flippase family protein [Sphingopyxis]|uniref:oligosaccharide flippase family protein n=1 Tax=Sphingopyxis TaxID=165697 RepID=UPI0016443402|nr:MULTISPECIES: oligosaccharide flippase family protein [Sphingopyxis]QXF11813.1 oligosaccharide flippase family protein [Sphingopyxis terrae subsp. terrae]
MGDYRTATFIRKATSVGAINIADRIVTAGLGIFLARLLEPAGYGAYSFVMSQVTLVALLAKLGLPELVLRDFAAGRGTGGGHVPTLLLRTAVILSSSSALILIAIGMLVLTTLYDGPNADEFMLGLLMMAPLALFEIYAGALRGLGYVVTFQIISTLGMTALTLIACVAYSVLFHEFSAFDALAIRMLIVVAACIAAIALVTRIARTQAASFPHEERARPGSRDTLKTSLSFLVIGVLHVVFISIDQLMLGYMIGESSVAIFKVAAEGAQMVAFAYVAGNAVLAPEYSRIFSSGDLALLERTARQSAAIVLAIALLPFFILSVFAAPIVTFVFGMPYAAAAAPLSVLALGHFLALLFGDPLYILNMTGHHQTSMRLTVVALTINVIFNAIAIPNFGVVGAATATSFSFVLLRMMAYFYVRSHLGIECSAVSGLNQIVRMGIKRG